MKRALILLVLLVMAQGALAEEQAQEKSFVQKAGEGVKKGAEATERGLKKGGEATVKGLKKAGEWVGKKMQKGGEKLDKASK
ncbi:MAG TPA: hypothetical protein VEP71_04655 [Gallionella sp.]|nr:hypothetical protein [Gallionella sp.]